MGNRNTNKPQKLKLKSPELRLFAVIEVIISISFGSVSWFKIWLSAHERVLLRTAFHSLATKIHQHLSKFVSERFFPFILKMLNLKYRLIVIGAYTKLPLRPPCVHMLQFSDSERQSLVYRKQFLISVL